MANESFDVIVVGAGVGGAACAGLLAKRGRKVWLLEKNAEAGGKAMAFSKDGFTYTPWVVITAPIKDNVFARVLKELGWEQVIVVSRQGSGRDAGTLIKRAGVLAPARSYGGSSFSANGRWRRSVAKCRSRVRKRVPV